MEIKTVTVELLRAGPRHNQLLSPLTQYLAVCGDAAACVMTLPYEHARFDAQMQELRYAIGADNDVARRRLMLHKTGDELAALLGAIPGLAGALSAGSDQLTHLRIVLSASELALLPFEITKVPVGTTGSPDGWLALQARSPVCISRRVRTVSGETVTWPTRPRILYVSGPDVPFESHHEVLLQVLEPWLPVARFDAAAVRHWLVAIENASLQDILDATSRDTFTHVHILAHGAANGDTQPPRVGVQLRDEVVSGGRLASALLSERHGHVHLPTVVTLATCDSAAETNVLTADASVAHELHEAGIPLVVASQFPLSEAGSIPFIERFYSGQLLGLHPLQSLYEVRRVLHSQFGATLHDWASLVVYEALPADLPKQLEELCYWQARRAHEAALSRLEDWVRSAAPNADRDALCAAYNTHVAAVEQRAETLPVKGSFAMESQGLRAAGHKRLAEAAFRIARLMQQDEARSHRFLRECHTHLEEARVTYRRAATMLLASPGNEGPQRKVTTHWLLTQVVSTDLILGRPFDLDLWTTARVTAQVDHDHQDEATRGWARVSLCELWLLRLADTALSGDPQQEAEQNAVRYAKETLDLCGRTSEQVVSTVRQIRRYREWWSEPAFASALTNLGVSCNDRLQVDGPIQRVTGRVIEALGGLLGTSAAVDVSTATRAPRMSGAEPGVRADLLGRSQSKPSIERNASDGPIFDLEMLPAENGDCLWIEYGSAEAPSRILIDCGSKSAANLLKSKVLGLGEKPQRFELFVLTHIDADHIGGVVPFFSARDLDLRFEDVWFNGWKQLRGFLSVEQGEEFSRLLEEGRVPWNRAITPADSDVPQPIVVSELSRLPTFTLAGGLQITVLSPRAEELRRLAANWRAALARAEPDIFLARKPIPQPVRDFEAFDIEKLAQAPIPRDPSTVNGSSIAVLLEFAGHSAILAGDAHASVLAGSLRMLIEQRKPPAGRLKVDAFKLSHHGSANAVTTELLDQLDCHHYLVSTDGSVFRHPDRESIARLIIHGGKEPTLHFNYASEMNSLWAHETLQRRYGYRTKYPVQGQQGLRLCL